MKKISKIMFPLATLGAVAGPIVAAVSCGGGNESGLIISAKASNPDFKGTKVTGKKLAAVVSDPENPRWQKAKENIKVNAQASGFESVVNIFKNSSDQSTWLNNQTSADAWIIGASDNSVAGAFTARTQAQPIIAYDRLIQSANRTAYNWYVAYDNARVGAFQGLSILGKIYNHDFITGNESKSLDDLKKDAVTYATANKLNSKKIILSLAGDPADNNAPLFYSGGMDIIKAVSSADTNLNVPSAFDAFKKVAQAKWDYSKAQTFLNGQLSQMSEQEKSQIAGVLSPNDGMATSAINALKNNGINAKEVYVTGQDSNDSAITSIYSGSGQDMTIYKPDTIASAVAVSLAKYLLAHNGDNVAPSSLNSNTNAIITSIQGDFGTIPMTYDGTQYEADSGKPVNTILLAPQIIKKSNLSNYFDISKK